MSEKEQSEKYGISVRTVRNWRAAAEAAGAPVPWGDPGELLEWYRGTLGREPNGRLLARVAELLGDGDGAGEDGAAAGELPAVGAAVGSDMGSDMPQGMDCETADGGVIGGVRSLELACESLGLSSTLARIVDEEERAWEAYEAARASGRSLAEARRNWKEAVEVKRAVHKTDDAVRVAERLLQDWARGEWEARWKRLRIQLGGVKLGAELREELLAAEDEKEFSRVWDKGLERAVLMWAEGVGGGASDRLGEQETESKAAQPAEQNAEKKS